MKKALIILSLIGLYMNTPAIAQESWPARPIKFIVPFPAGGSMDTFSRPIALQLGKNLGVPVVVENRGGAGGAIGITEIAKSKPDGYTIGMSSIGNMVINPHIYKNLAYNPLSDFSYIGLAGKFVNVLEVNNKSSIESVKNLVDVSKENPGKITFGSAGNGSTNHLSGELLKLLTGADFTHVPYRGSGPALMDLQAGTITFMFDTLNTSMGHIKANTLRPLAVTSPKRSPFLPDVPTMDEMGITGYAEAGRELWWGIIGPAGIPDAIQTKLSTELAKALNSKEVMEQIKSQYLETWSAGPQEFSSIVQKDYKNWGNIVKKMNISIN